MRLETEHNWLPPLLEVSLQIQVFSYHPSCISSEAQAAGGMTHMRFGGVKKHGKIG